MDLNIPDSVISFLVTKGHSPEMGARPLRRVVEQYLEDPLAEMLLKESADKKLENYARASQKNALFSKEKKKLFLL